MDWQELQRYGTPEEIALMIAHLTEGVQDDLYKPKESLDKILIKKFRDVQGYTIKECVNIISQHLESADHEDGACMCDHDCVEEILRQIKYHFEIEPLMSCCYNGV